MRRPQTARAVALLVRAAAIAVVGGLAAGTLVGALMSHAQEHERQASAIAFLAVLGVWAHIWIAENPARKHDDKETP